ncbi:hypothetical protein BH24GEM1_BH24GEM1_23460 [soil metagenome]|nr:hypothetical protein [Gemmatimonadales bacterium]
MRVHEDQQATLHARTFVVDGTWVSVRTMDFHNRSLALDDESTLMVCFLGDLRHSEEIGPAVFGRRPPVRLVVEWAAILITRLP